jgi:hypothetical protein
MTFNLFYEQQTILHLTDDEIESRYIHYSDSDIKQLLSHPWTVYRAKKALDKLLVLKASTADAT